MPLLVSADINRPLDPGTYGIGFPFGIPFTVTFESSWTLKSLSGGDVSFVRSTPASGAAWLVIDVFDNAFVDPCKDALPAVPAVPSTPAGFADALASLIGFKPGPVSDITIDGHAGKAIDITNALDTAAAGCVRDPFLSLWTTDGAGTTQTVGGARDQVWAVDVDGRTLVFDGETFPETPPDQVLGFSTVVGTVTTGSTHGPTVLPSPGTASTSTPAPGAISGRFDVGGRSMFIDCRGTGSPTIVFLVGTDAPRTQMRALEDRVLERGVRVCDYDRAGNGQSDAATGDQQVLDITDDLAALLAAAKVPAPYVLVGHSVGGDQAWVYASRHPKGVAGFLLMNAGAFVLPWDRLEGIWTKGEITDEQAHVAATLGEVKQAADPPAGVPYVVMLSTIAQCASTTDVCGRVYPLYEEWAKALAARSPDGRFVSVVASHTIFSDDPDAVLTEVDKLLDAIR